MSAELTEYERERAANIEKNRALLQQLQLDEGPKSLGFVAVNPLKKGGKARVKDGAKPVQPRKSAGKKRKAGEDKSSDDEIITRRMSTRRRRGGPVDPNETPEEKAIREKLEKERAAREEQDRVDALALAMKAKEPRHQDLDLQEVLEAQGDEEENEKSRALLLVQLGELCRQPYPRATGRDSDKEKGSTEKENVKNQLDGMKIVSRAKVTGDRIYSMAYHPEKTKDLIFFGDKHGQLGIWDARAPAPPPSDGDNAENQEGGQYWRLQAHWPATSKSSISSVKVDPIDGHSVFTSAYDCTIRRTFFNSGISTELYALDDTLISSFDFTSNGHELYISDTKGGVTHLDTRANRHEATRYQLSGGQKIGCVSLNPVDGWSLLASCNDRSLKLWDTRQLKSVPAQARDPVDFSSAIVEPYEVEYDDITERIKDTKTNAILRGTSVGGFSISSAYWDSTGSKILSTCYDDHLRVWDLPRKNLSPHEPLKTFEPAVIINHDCQTGRWLTVFKAQWNQNPDVYPYFSVGDMKHSLKIFAADGDLIADLKDKTKVTAVQAVTATHPNVVGRAASGNASGRAVLWSTD